ncbi:PilW family protein [Selenihalanaerobacter shriftii]|uniref:Prepilin-type N-terminal cleavage/methylation domain-containing protein n=1 Tax=Selenihalanaerobacter shriftii TaxID=142842 RepID=A0A1T4P3T8_9FIRM|nr:prepilin-type N-terminal cleavage/methylation domain-containing protein [Selenihalanaerobacter shriftii]SJZ86174.1 prepilin-type N-terminal cleavage/methylation domain-containing protein [Selenihalanaerobacter shriftii]
MIKQEEGFTLIEILIVLAILGVVSTAIYNINITSWRVFHFNQDQVDLQQNGRIAMLRIVDRVKGAMDVRVVNNGEENDELQIKWENEDEDGNININYSRYSVSDNTLYYEYVLLSEIPSDDSDSWPTDNDWNTLSRSAPITTEVVDSIQFNSNSTTDAGNVNLLGINLSLSENPGNNDAQTYELHNEVFLRNVQ